MLHIYDPVYCQNYYVVITPTEKEFLAILKNRINLTLESKEYSNGRFVVVEKNKTLIGIIWSKDKKCNLIHECFHAISWALRRKGLSLTDDTDEAFAYNIQFLVRAILEK